MAKVSDTMSITNYTDVVIPIDVEGYDLSKMSGMHVTCKQGTTVVDITDVVITGEAEITVILRQEHTSQFRSGEPLSLMLNYFDEYGFRRASDEFTLSVKSNLLRRILNNE